MNEFENLIRMIGRLDSKDEAISIHRTAVHIERFNANQHNLDYLLLDDSYYNAVSHYLKEHTSNMVDDISVIWHFRDDPEYAETYLQAVNLDGMNEEVTLVNRWYRYALALGPIKRRVMRKA